MTSYEHDLVIDFIMRRWVIPFSNYNTMWTDGNCYWFAVILKTRFPQLEIYYDEVAGHFVAGYGDNFFDINGDYMPNKPSDVVLFNNMKYGDTAHYNRVLKDCIL